MGQCFIFGDAHLSDSIPRSRSQQSHLSDKVATREQKTLLAELSHNAASMLSIIRPFLYSFFRCYARVSHAVTCFASELLTIWLCALHLPPVQSCACHFLLM